MKTYLINLRSRIRAKDVVAIYTCALIDVALVAAAVGLILYFV